MSKLATVADYVAAEWKPWDQPQGDEIDMSDGAFRTMGATVRMARNMMGLTKAQTMGMCETMSLDSAERAVDNFRATAVRLRKLADMLSSASVRTLCALETIYGEDDD